MMNTYNRSKLVCYGTPEPFHQHCHRNIQNSHKWVSISCLAVKVRFTFEQIIKKERKKSKHKAHWQASFSCFFFFSYRLSKQMGLSEQLIDFVWTDRYEYCGVKRVNKIKAIICKAVRRWEGFSGHREPWVTCQSGGVWPSSCSHY